MQPEIVFSVCNTSVLFGWIVLIAGFRRAWSVRVARWMVVVYAVIYSIVIGLHFGSAESFNSLAAVMKLFDDPWLTTGGWIHYLAFDLFIGAWIVAEAQRDSLPWWRVLPALPLTLMFGPAGLLLFTALRGKGF